MKLFFVILSITLFTISCKDDKKEGEGTVKNNEIVKKKYEGNFLYRATINSDTGAILKDINSGEKLTEIPANAEVLITKFHNFETKYVMNRIKVHGKWAEVIYQTKDTYLTGKVFDGYLDYQFDVKESNINIDTVVVKNEREFFNALSSNRTIIVDTNEINLDKGKNIIENSDEYAESFYGISYDEYPETLNLSNFSNLEIKGKNLVDFITHDSEANVISFNNCSNVYIDNINFYHKEVGSCDGDVLTFSECNNFYFQNSHFDGSGLTAIYAAASQSLNFLNCDFYNNHDLIISSYDTNTKDINLFRCNIYGNELSYCIFSVDEITISDCYIVDNIVPSLIESRDTHKSNYIIENSLITKNDFTDDMINLISDTNISLKNTDFIANTSTSNKYFLDEKEDRYSDTKISLQNVSFKDNIDFYDLKRAHSTFSKKENVLINSVFNKNSDTLITKFNEAYYNGVTCINRSDKDFIYNNATKEFSINGHLLQGVHKLDFSKRNEFFEFQHNSSDKGIGCSAFGKVVDGKLEGEWEIKNSYDRDIVEFSNGIVQKLKKVRKINKSPKKTTIIQKGEFVEGKRDGVFEYFYEDGMLRKKLTFKNGELDYPQEFYFPSGKLRFTRTKNKSTHYHPNGVVIAEIVYTDDEKIDVNASSYYDVYGSLKETQIIPKGTKYHINGGLSVNFEGAENIIFAGNNYNTAEFVHPGNSIARYKVAYTYFIHKSLKEKSGANDYAECYMYDNSKFVYIFDNNHDIVYKAEIQDDINLDLHIYNRKNNLKYAFKQYVYDDNVYKYNGAVKYLQNGYSREYEYGKEVKR